MRNGRGVYGCTRISFSGDLSLFFSRFFLPPRAPPASAATWRVAARRTTRASVAGGRSQSGVNPVDRHGDAGIRQREHVVLIFRISLHPRLSWLFFSRPFFEIALSWSVDSASAVSASEIIRVGALHLVFYLAILWCISMYSLSISKSQGTDST